MSITMHCHAARHGASRVSTSRRVTVTVRASSISPINRKSRKDAARQRATGPTAASAPSPQYPALQESVPADILTSFFYGRALAITISKRLGELVVEVVAEISKQAAERPQRIKDFQEQVQLLAQQEMAAAGVAPPGSPGAHSSSTGQQGSGAGPSNSSSNAASNSKPEDLSAAVDELRAEIAYSRAILQQLKAGSSSSNGTGPSIAAASAQPASTGSAS